MKSKFSLLKIQFLLGLLFLAGIVHAHTINYYTGTCNTGPTYSVQPNVSAVNWNSNYAWQYKNASGVYVCITNGNNTINGNTYSVTGAYQTATIYPGPIVFTNPNSALNGLEIRCLISDGANPCSMPSGNTWTSSSNFVIAVNGTSCSNCNNLTDPGLIGSNESFCGTSFNPSIINNITSPSGGSSAAIEYMWLSTTDAGTAYGSTWNVVTIAGASSATYDPPTISQTTWYRRCARRAGCTNYDAESNWVMKELSCCGCVNNMVVNNSFEYGTVGWDYYGGNFNAGTGAVYCGVKSGDFQITNSSSNWVSQEIFPTTYAQGTALNVSVYAGVHDNSYYQEVFVDYFDANWNWLSNTAVEVNKILGNAPVGPQLYTFTSTIPAGVGHVSIGFSGNGNWIKTDNWCVTQGPTCNNLTAGGTIGNDESICGTSFDPANIVELTAPSGGSGTIEYMWLVSTDGGTTYTTISGASGSTYDPGVISQTTWYRRCARRAGCTAWVGESNWVKKELKTPVTANAGSSTTLTCTTTSTTLGVAAVSGYTYSWSPTTGLSSSTIAQPVATPVVTTTYTVTVTGANGCTATSSVLINVNKTSPIAAAGAGVTLTCTSPSATIGTTTTSGYTYSWSPSTGLSSTTISNPVATPTTTTTYTVTVTGSNGCTATSSVTVTVNKTPPTANAGVSATLTCTTTSAIIGSAAIGGNTYSWSPATGLSSTTIAQPTANPSATTTYTVTVTGANGCTATSSVTVTVNTGLPVANAGSASTLTCSTTSATLGATAVAGYTYSWSPATGLSSTTIAQPVATPTTTTTYTVTVTNSNGCTATSAVTITVNKTPPTANAGSTATLTCTSTSTTIGSAAIAGNTYAWSPSTGLSSTTVAQPVASPTTTTTYTVTVTGSNGCTATSVVVINVNTAPPVANAGSATTLTCTSSSTIIGTTALAGNTYAWSPSTGLSSVIIAQPTANPTSTTTYTVTVTGSNGCTATSSVTITVNTTPPTANPGSPVTLTCTTPTATIGSTSVAGYSYSWSPATGLSSATIAQPTANPTSTTTYTLTVTNSNGCTASGTVLVTVNKSLPTANAGNTSTLNCTTTSTTIGSVAVSGNTYSWSPATGLSSTTVAQPTANPTSTTTYTVTVTGSNGCTATSSVTITVNTVPPTANAGIDRNLNCTITSANIGSTAVAGNTYSWSPATGLSSTTIAQPVANPTVTTNYTVTVTGANGCTATDVVIVNVDQTLPVANAGNDGIVNCSINSVVLGTASVSGYTYNWNPFMTLSSNNVAQPTANPTSTTTYTLTVTGTNGCTASDMVTITVNVTPPSADAGVDKIITCTTPSAVIGTAATPGTTNTYSWSPATGLSATNIAQPTATPTTTTTYTVTVTGSNGCTATDAVMVSVNKTAPTVTATAAPSTICLGSSSTISATGGGTYLWNTGATTASFTASPTSTTTYTVTVTGANGCTATSTTTLTVNPTTTNGNATITACNSYTWNGTTYTTSGVYTYTSLNTYGCLNTATLTLTINYSSTNGNLTITNCGPYTWNGTTYTASGTYTYTTLNASGCVNTATLNLTINTAFTPSIVSSSCHSNGTDNVTNDDYITFILQPSAGNLMLGKKYTVTATQAGNPITITLSDGTPATGLYFGYPNAFRTANGTAGQGNITLTLTAANGCSNTATVLLTDPGTCGTTLPPCTNGTVTYTYRTPYQTTNLSNVALNIPKFDDMGGTRTLNSVSVNYTASLGAISVLENTSASAITATISSTNDATLKLGTTTLLSGALAPLSSGAQTYGAPVLVPAGTNASSWPGDSVSGIQQSTLNRSLKLGLEDYLQSINVNPTQSLAWVTNITGLNSTDDDMNFFSSTGTISGSGVYSSATDIAPFIGTGNTTLNASTNTNSSVSGGGGNMVFIVRTKAYAEVTVTYNYTTACYGSVGNYVWADSNHNGLNDEAAAAGLNGVTVQLYQETAPGSGTYTLAQTTTTANSATGAPGYYLFTISQSANYYVHFPSSTTGTDQLTSQTTTAATDNNSDASTTSGNSPVFAITVNGTGVAKNNNTIDAGYVPLLSLGNTVWVDANKNGIKDATENGISGATVNLYVDNNNDGSPDGAAVATTTTNSNGLYVFNNVFPGNYVVGVVPSTPTSGNAFVSSPINEANPNSNVDNNDNGVTTTAGQTFSGTITLLAGTEPTGETPNNGTAPDASSNLTLDFGFYQPVNISGNVFVDNNGPTNVDGTGVGTLNSTQLYANLVGPSGTVVAVVAVNANGTYNFLDVTPNTNYTMVLSSVPGTVGGSAPSTTLPTGWTNVSEDCCDNTGNDGTTNGITFVNVGTTDLTNVNFGVREMLSLGNLVWNDVNKNGLKEASEIGIQGATVKLYNDANSDGAADGPAIATTTTNSNGLYVFNDLYAGNYIIGVTPPTPATGNDYESSTVGQESNPNLNVDNNDNGIIKVGGETVSGTITLSLGAEPTGETPNNGTASDANSNLTIDFGFYQPVNIAGNVFVDNNGPANVDGTGIGAPGGTQLYANLVNAAGTVDAVVPVNPNGTYYFADVRPNTTFTMVLSTVPGTVGSVPPTASLPTGWANVSEDCCDNTGNDGTTNGVTTVTVALTDVTNVNFGIRETMSIGNAVWNDINKNGLKDPSELGISGAVVKLYADANSDGSPDGAAIATMTTTSTGLYVFNDLTPGNYLVGVTPPVVISGNSYVSSPINETNPNLNVDNNDNGIVTTASGEVLSGTVVLALGTEPTGETPNNGTANDANSNLTIDFGFYQPINISGNVFVDNNGPTNVDGVGIGTPGGVQVFANLVNSAGNVVAVVPVNSNGSYSFLDVTPNTSYTMVLSTTQGTVGSPAPSASLPNGWANVSEDCCDNTGNDGTTNGITSVTVGFTSVTNVNFGIREPLSLGNLVWNDVNRNGLKEATENGISGAIVNLYADANTDGSPDGAALFTTTTNSNGLYVFNDLSAGSYIVGVTPPVPAVGNDYESSIVGEEANPNLNIDNNDNGIIKIGGETVSGTVTLALGTEPTGETPNNASASDLNGNLTVDFGFYQPVNISGNVFVDNNGPTNVDGTGIGAPSGTQLYANLVNASGLVDAVVPVNPTGTYYFSDVRPNTTFTMVLSTVVGTIGATPPAATLPAGWVNVSEDCCDNTGNDGTTNGITTVTVGLLDVPNVNFGIKQPLSVGNLVWEDANRNGLKDASENGIAGATVNLYIDANSDGVPDGAAIQTTTSSATGLYVFNGLDQGNYVIGVVPPTGTVYTSSINGQEVNPNLNVDNNDNGIVTISGETRSGTIILAANTEPLGETPNNGTAPDANSNLTIDFGFFICPSGFTFNPQYVCPGNTLNLTALEPVNYTGGVWSQGGVPVSSTNVTVGTYVYTFSNGACTSTGTVTVGTNVPDYTPTISIAPSAITGTQNVRVIINISEILNKPSCSDVYIFVPRLEPRFTFSYEPTATTMGGITVANADWQFFTSNPNFYVWKYVGAPTFPANGSSKLGFIGPYNPTNTDGETSFSVQIYQGSGGETNINNNIDSENLIYFR